MDAPTLRQLLDYDPETGLFTWRSGRRRGWIGKRAGTLHSLGYIRILIAGQAWLAHRLAWLHVYGQWPQFEIDHINGKRSDNRIANLRDVTHAVNALNRQGPTVRNKSGFRGVYWKARERKWIAKIGINGSRKELGRFDDAQSAAQAYELALREISERATPS